jgi:hypothetical protein
MSTQNSLPEQATLELAMTAAAAERSNRPRRLVIGAILLLAAATTYTLIALGSRSAAADRAGKESGELASLRVVVANLNALREMATALNLPDPQTTTDENTTTKAEGFIYRKYNSRIEGAEADLLLRWVSGATSGPGKIAGLQLYSVSLTPGRTLPPPPGHAGWNLRAVFSRWERKQ